MIRIFLTVLILCLSFSASFAQEKLNFNAWSTLPVLHEGRLKPLDSFSKIYLETFSNKQEIDGLSANEWLAQTIFTPDISLNHRVHFSRFHNEKGAYYTYEEIAGIVAEQNTTIQALLEIPQDRQTPEQKELMRLYENYILHTQLLRAFTALLPLDLENNNTLKSFLDYKDHEISKNIQQKLNILSQAGANNVLLRIIPDGESWLSPWQIVNQKDINIPTKDNLILWQRMAVSYILQDQKNWQNAVQQSLDLNSTPRLTIEKIYNDVNFIFIAKILYILSLSIVLIRHFAPNITPPSLAGILLFAGIITHFFHLLLRIYILERAPVGTLYESILFVSFICVSGLFFMAIKQKKSLPLLLSGLSGTILLLTAKAFAGIDTMGTLEAVLNTNFWLSTHVICITIGYGVCLITSLVAHCYFLLKENSFLLPTIKGLALLSLLFTAIGTILGGLWADQSWGRFWGWDPKENGALLIVLWIIWLLHSRLTRHLTDDGFAAGAAFLSVIVVLAWFGVNLLSVGLHSYGFISDVAWGIGLFCTAEIVTIGGLWFYRNSKTA